MFKRLHYVIIFLNCLSTVYILGQECSVSGRVVDQEENALISASILSYKDSSSVIYSFALSNPDGTFNLALACEGVFRVEISFLAFERYSVEIQMEDVSRDLGDIRMSSADLLLETLVITGKPPPSYLKGDSTIFTIDSFVVDSDRKLKDVITRMPFVTTDMQDNIYFKGRKVDKVTVESEMFFTGASSFANKYIPSRNISNLQFIDNARSTDFMKSSHEDGDLVLNIELKNDDDQFLFGDVYGGYGLNKHYRVHGDLFYYSKKWRANFIGDMNNIGQDPVSIMEYLRFYDFNMSDVGMGSIYSAIAAPSIFSLLPDGHVAASAYKSSFFNLTGNLSRKLKLSLNSMLYRHEISRQSRADRSYLLPGANRIREVLTEEDRANFTPALATANIVYTPSEHSVVHFNVRYLRPSEQQVSQLNSITTLQNQQIGNTMSSHEENWEGEIKGDHKLSAQLTHSYIAKYSRQTRRRGNEFQFIDASQTYWPYIPIDSTLTAFSNNSGTSETARVVNRANLRYSNRAVLMGIIEYVHYSDRFASELEVNPDLDLAALARYQGQSRRQFSLMRAGVVNSLVQTNLRLNTGLNWYNQTWSLTPRNQSANQILFVPYINIKATAVRVAEFTLSYQMASLHPQIEDYTQALQIESYNQVVLGNVNLAPTLPQTIHLSINRSNWNNKSNLLLTISHRWNQNIIANRVLNVDISSLTTYEQDGYTWQSNSLFVLYSRLFSRGKMSGSVMYRNEASDQYFGLDLTKIKASVLNANIDFSYPFVPDKLVASAVATASRNQNTFGVISTNLNSYSFMFNSQIDFWRNIGMNISGSWNAFQQEGGELSTLHNMNVSFNYRLNKLIDIRLRGLNLLSNNFTQTNTATSAFLEQKRSEGLGRFVLFEMIYHL